MWVGHFCLTLLFSLTTIFRRWLQSLVNLDLLLADLCDEGRGKSSRPIDLQFDENAQGNVDNHKIPLGSENLIGPAALAA
jgi:hypothetical protein